MRSILKYGLIGGVILGLGYRFMVSGYVFALHMVVFPGAMMFAINDFLSTLQNQKNYSYIIGVLIGFLTGLLAAIMGWIVFFIINDQKLVEGAFLYLAKMSVIQSLPLMMISSFLIPVLYLKKSPKEVKSTDILDEEI